MNANFDSEQGIPSMDILDDLNYWVYKIGSLRAALELKLWEIVASGEDTADKVAASQGWDLAGTHLILDAMVDINLLKCQGGQYALVPVSEYSPAALKTDLPGDVLLGERGVCAR
jgi:hypothetical protein